MGIFDTYGDVQLKVGDVDMSDYRVGDKALIPDGVYFAPEGVVIIYHGFFVAEISLDAVFDKWGGKVEIDIDLRNPVTRAIKRFEKENPMPDDVHEICRQIAKDIWKSDRNKNIGLFTNAWKEDVFIDDMVRLLRYTSVPKMVEALIKAKDHMRHYRAKGESGPDGVYIALYNALQGDKPVEESLSSPKVAETVFRMIDGADGKLFRDKPETPE